MKNHIRALFSSQSLGKGEKNLKGDSFCENVEANARLIPNEGRTHRKNKLISLLHLRSPEPFGNPDLENLNLALLRNIVDQLRESGIDGVSGVMDAPRRSRTYGIFLSLLSLRLEPP